MLRRMAFNTLVLAEFLGCFCKVRQPKMKQTIGADDNALQV